jgi:hypothetical protein
MLLLSRNISYFMPSNIKISLLYINKCLHIKKHSLIYNEDVAMPDERTYEIVLEKQVAILRSTRTNFQD